VLENFLLDFPGNLIVVSHDRYFMDKIVDHLFVFRGNAVIEDFPGNYSDYRAYEDLKIKEAQEAEKPKTPKKSYKQANPNREAEKELKKLDKEIEQLTIQKAEIEEKFNNNTIAIEEIEKLSLQLKDIIAELSTKEERWLELSMFIDENGEFL
jgi:ATP-binding cassette subfamily F protein uup